MLDREQLIVTLSTLASENSGIKLTRNFFREKTGLFDSVWEKHFGTWAEYKRASNLEETAQQKAFSRQIAKHSSISHYKAISDTRMSWGDKYERNNKSRFKTLLIASDLHDKEIDPFFLQVFLDTAERSNPDVVVLCGDVFDLPEFSRYTVDPRDWDVVGRIRFAHEEIFGPLRLACPEAQIDLIEGNHESVEKSTEILTTDGWVRADEITQSTSIASYDIGTGEIGYDLPVAIKHTLDQPLACVKGTSQDELLYVRHKIDIDGSLQYVEDFFGQEVRSSRFRYSGTGEQTGIDLSNDMIRLLTWVVMDGCLVYKFNKTKQIPYVDRIQFKLSKERKINALRSLLDKMGIVYTFRECKKTGVNKLQPYYICIYGDSARLISGELSSKKELPSYFKRLNKSQLTVFLETLSITDGNVREDCHGISWRTVSKSDVDIVQIACISNGVSCYFNIKENQSGFKNGKLQYQAVIGRSATYSKAKIESLEQTGDIVSIQSSRGTLITRRNGKVAFTGNCRLLKMLAETSPAMVSVLGDLHGFTIEKLFGLDQFEINYIAKGNLAAWTKRDQEREISKNYKIYYDCFLTHHYPHARSMGFPGVNGHHHKHLVFPHYSPIFGSYEWHQLGCGHKREASYCEAEKWANGFALAHIDSHKKLVNIEYIPITDHAVVGGKWYYRD